MLAAGGESWIIEASERDLLLTGARRPGGIEVTPPIAPTYDQRAASYGDPSDDLTRAISGLDGAKVWVTRATGIVAARTFGDDLAVTVASGASKSPFLLTTQPSDCAPAVVMMPATMTPAPVPVTTKPSPREPGPPAPPTQGPVLVETTIVEAPPSEHVEVSGSCDGSPSSQPQESSTSDDSCSHSDTSSDSSSSDDGCDSSPNQSSSDSTDSTDDGCDSGSSSSDSSTDKSGDGCDSGSDSSSSTNSNCTLSRRPKRGRSRTSLVAWGICAVLLPLRRSMRRRDGVGRC